MNDHRLASEAWESLFRSQVALMRRFAADDIWHPISMREYDVLFTLTHHEGHRLQMSELNRQILLAQPSLSRMIDRLVDRGLVRREESADDKRARVVCLTPDGLRLQRTIGARHVRSIARYVGSALDEAEIRRLQELTTKLRLAQDHIPDHEPEREPRRLGVAG